MWWQKTKSSLNYDYSEINSTRPSSSPSAFDDIKGKNRYRHILISKIYTLIIYRQRQYQAHSDHEPSMLPYTISYLVPFFTAYSFDSFAKISVSLNNKYSSSPTLILDPPNAGNRTLSPAFTAGSIRAPVLMSGIPGPTASTSASLSFSVFFSGMKMPDAVWVWGLRRCTSTRSRRGMTDLMDLRADWSFS